MLATGTDEMAARVLSDNLGRGLSRMGESHTKGLGYLADAADATALTTAYKEATERDPASGRRSRRRVVRSASVLWTNADDGKKKTAAFEPLIDQRAAALLDEVKAAYQLQAAQRGVAGDRAGHDAGGEGGGEPAWSSRWAAAAVAGEARGPVRRRRGRTGRGERVRRRRRAARLRPAARTGGGRGAAGPALPQEMNAEFTHPAREEQDRARDSRLPVGRVHAAAAGRCDGGAARARSRRHDSADAEGALN